MASKLDREQEQQLQAVKDFWDRFGNLITWVLIVALGAYAAWNGWNYWQRRQGAQASALFAEIETSIQANDQERLQRVLDDMKSRYGRTTYAAQSALLAARVLADDGHSDQAAQQLEWVADKASDKGLRAVARLRLASVQMDQEQYDQALKTLSASVPPEFAAVAADRRGDILMLQGRRDQAAAEYGKAYQGLGIMGSRYRQLVGIKLNALGIDPDTGSDSGSTS